MLGAGGEKRTWKFDFMGASKYFFSMSGVILLVGALAIGGKGLNLGIDFTSGTRITVGLEQAASQQQVSQLLSSQGVSNPQVQKVSGSKTFGNNAYQISFKTLPSGGREKVQTALQNKFGIAGNGKDFQYTSVGPTFGSTVANSAVIAIIASLLVIAAYVALRFEWKFAIPVMIALAHDLLITSGVYALTGRQVTTATVAALLTILGYSMYDTIIVFDRVRENIPRMPRAAFSQIVNRSMSEVLTRSIATTSCTLMPIIALLLFGGTPGSTELTDFAFALLVGVASGAYSSIFIASPVLTHWKERESQYRHRRQRIESEFGYVPAYATTAADVEPTRRARRTGRLTELSPEGVSAAEFEEMKRDLDLELAEEDRQRGRTSTLTKRLARSAEEDDAAADEARQSQRPRSQSGITRRSRRADGGTGRAGTSRGGSERAGNGAAQPPQQPPSQQRPSQQRPAQQRPSQQSPEQEPEAQELPADDVTPAPDVAENEGMAPTSKRPQKPRSRNRRHGRRR
jgi:SecD/SecF fusion protein